MDSLTVFCPFTRTWAVLPFFNALTASDVPFARADFLGYVDSDDRRLENAVTRHADDLGFRSVVTHRSDLMTPNDGPGPVKRRRRHSLMRQRSQELLGSDGRLLLLEDDTLIPPDTYARLSETLEGCDWAIGAEVGRWGESRPPGLWRLKMEEGQPRRLSAVLPTGSETERVDATGLYCALTRMEVYRELDFGTWSNVLGLDTHATWKLTQAGRRLFVNWRVPCVHLTPQGPLTMAEAQEYSRPLFGLGFLESVSVAEELARMTRGRAR